MPGESLSGRVMRAGLWVAGARLGARLLTSVRVLVLARLLTPHDFGLMALALIPLSLLESLGTTGTHAALIHRQAHSRALLDTAWTLGVCRRLLAAVILAAGAPLLAGFFASPDAAGVIRAMALLPIVQGLRNIGTVEFQQELRFSQDTLLDATGRLAETVVAIALAVWLRNAWALVAGALVGGVVSTVMTYVRHPYRPRFRLDRQELGVLVRYGRWVVGARVITWAVANGMDALIGRALGVAALGTYQMAERVSLLPTAQLPRMAGQVTLPAFAKLQASPGRIRDAYRRVLAMVALVIFPIAALLAAYADGLVRVLLGPRWAAVPPIVEILAVHGTFRCLAATAGPLFQGLGRPAFQAVTAGAELAGVALALWPLFGHGIRGIAAAAALGAGLAMLVALALAARFLRLGPGDLLRTLGPPGLGVVAILGLRAATPAPESIAPLAAALLGSLALYAGVLLGLSRLGAYSLDPQVRTVIARWRPLASVFRKA